MGKKPVKIAPKTNDFCSRLDQNSLVKAGFFC